MKWSSAFCFEFFPPWENSACPVGASLSLICQSVRAGNFLRTFPWCIFDPLKFFSANQLRLLRRRWLRVKLYTLARGPTLSSIAEVVHNRSHCVILILIDCEYSSSLFILLSSISWGFLNESAQFAAQKEGNCQGVIKSWNPGVWIL